MKSVPKKISVMVFALANVASFALESPGPPPPTPPPPPVTIDGPVLIFLIAAIFMAYIKLRKLNIKGTRK